MKGSVINDIKAASYNLYKIAHAKFRNILLPAQVWGRGTLTFACFRGSDYCFGFKILNFAICLGVEVLSTISMGMPILAGIFGVCRFPQVFFWGVSLKMLFYGVFFFIYKVQ